MYLGVWIFKDSMDFDVLDLGVIDYEECFALQKKLHSQVHKDDKKSILMILEHPPVITLGRSGKRDNIFAEKQVLQNLKIKIVSVDRGGDATIHMPGQLLAYPIFNLKLWEKSVHLFVFALEEVMIRFFLKYGVEVKRKKNYPGVWAKDSKIGFIGTGISKWVSFHGISMNLNCENEFFSLIRPCGIEGVKVTSLCEVLGHNVDFEKAKDLLAELFKNVFCEKLSKIKSFSASFS